MFIKDKHSKKSVLGLKKISFDQRTILIDLQSRKSFFNSKKLLCTFKESSLG